jgi:hypothetical protein
MCLDQNALTKLPAESFYLPAANPRSRTVNDQEPCRNNRIAARVYAFIE